MKVLTLLLTLILIMTVAMNGENLGELEDVFKPESMKIYNNRVYVVQVEKVLVFDLNGLKKTGEFGKKGTGPGESQVVPNFDNVVEVGKQGIVIDNFRKFLTYSSDLKYIGEVKKGAKFRFLMGIRFAGNGYLGSKVKTEGAQKLSASIVLTDNKFNILKELHSMKLGQQNRIVNPIANTPGYVVVGDKIFINKGDHKKIHIDVFDLTGKPLYSIEKSEAVVKVDSGFKNKIIKEFKEDPKIVTQIKMVGGWAAFQKIISLEFPDECPLVQSMDSDGKSLFIRTFKRNSREEDEFIVMDLKGKELKRVHIGIPRMGAIEKMVGRGIKRYAFSKGIAYWLYDNDEEETVELHSMKVY